MAEGIREDICPFCCNDNDCGAHKEARCWCCDEGVPMELRDMVSVEKQMKACICLNCIREFKENPEDFKGKYS
jgi:hypothetical protein